MAADTSARGQKNPRPLMDDYAPVLIRLTHAERKQLNAVAKAAGTSMTEVVRREITDLIDPSQDPNQVAGKVPAA